MNFKNLRDAIRAPYMARHGLSNATYRDTRVDYAYDNNFSLRWRNAANTADIDVLKVNTSDAVVFAGGVAPTGLISFNGIANPQTAAATTSGSLITAGTGGTWLAHSVAGACGIKLLLANTSATGNFASLRVRARSDVATPTWNQNTIACDLSASANIANYGELIGLSSYVQDNGNNQARADHWTTGAKVCTLHTGTSAGSRFGLLVTDASTTKAATKHYLARFDKPAGACAIDGVFSMGNCDQFTYLFNCEVAGGYLVDTGDAGSTKAGYLIIKTPAGDKKIQLLTT